MAQSQTPQGDQLYCHDTELTIPRHLVLSLRAGNSVLAFWTLRTGKSPCRTQKPVPEVRYDWILREVLGSILGPTVGVVKTSFRGYQVRHPWSGCPGVKYVHDGLSQDVPEVSDYRLR